MLHSTRDAMKQPLLADSKEEPDAPRLSAIEKRAAKNSMLGINLLSFQRGDIVLFLSATPGASIKEQMVNYGSNLLNKASDNYFLSTAGICTGFEKKYGETFPLITRVTPKGLKQERLNDRQPVLIFRPHLLLRGLIEDKANQVYSDFPAPKLDCCPPLNHFFKQSNPQTVSSLDPFKNPSLLKTKEPYDFILRVVLEALDNCTDIDVKKDYFLPADCINSLQTLEAELFDNLNYEMHFYLGKGNPLGNPYDFILGAVNEQVLRLRDKTTAEGRKKYKTVITEKGIAEKLFNEEENASIDDLTKANLLSKWMLEEFEHNTGLNLKKPTSYTAMQPAVRGLSLFNAVLYRYDANALQELKRRRLSKPEVNEIEMSVRTIPHKQR